jgi:hypothetical protein
MAKTKKKPAKPAGEPVEMTKTHRNFDHGSMVDCYGKKISIQDSSSASEPRIWLGLEDYPIEVLTDKGWKEYPVEDLLPDNAVSYGNGDKHFNIANRMHINKEHAKTLVKLLQRFIRTGSIGE